MDSCPNCGAHIEESDNYCGQCRFKLAVDKMGAALTHREINVEEVRSNLGLVYSKMGKVKEALEIFEKNLETKPNDKHAKQMVNLIKEELNKIADE